MKKRIITILTILILLVLYSCPIYAVSSTYNLRDYIQIKIKDQEETGACWTLAIGTAFETNLLLKNNTRYEVSSRHMDYATSQSFLGNQINEMGFARNVDSGGTAELALAYLTNGLGPVPEEEMPFSKNFDNINLSDIQNKTTQYQLVKWVQFPEIIKLSGTEYVNDEGKPYIKSEIEDIRNQIKEHIIRNGAVYAGLNAEEGFSKYYNSDTYAYNCNDYNKNTDHAVVIIGWDDNYSKYNFKQDCMPSTDGAYIVQNSWGEDDERLNNGTFYVSYEDAIIEEGIYGIVDIRKKNYTNLYQYDELGRNQYYEIKGIDEAYGANVFERKSSEDEFLTQVAISTYMKVNCEIYVNPTDETFSKDKLIKVAEQTIEPGYTDVYLNNAVKLTGKKFAVVVKYKKADDILGITTICNYKGPGTNLYSNMESNPGESYIGTELGNMKDFYESGIEDTNICIKAFTVPKLQGDVNKDGKVSALDLSLLQMHIVKLQLLENQASGDINEDGEISVADLSLLMMILVHLI